MRGVSEHNEIFKSCTLLILDGWGIAAASTSNAIKLAKTPHMDYLYRHSYQTQLQASGEYVGLPKGTIGNSEVGHLTIGAGRTILQPVQRINNAIETGVFFTNPELLKAIQHVQEQGSSIHLIGLLSDANVHATDHHLHALLKLCADHALEKVFIHVITDGRDTPPDSSYRYLTKLQEQMKLYHCGSIASVSGRYYAMDRDQRWDRTEKAYRALIAEENTTQYVESAFDGIRQSYNEGKTDEFILPFRITLGEDRLQGLIHSQDAVIFSNFREDRARQLTMALSDPNFHEFQTKQQRPYMVTMTDYEQGLCEHVVFEKEVVAGPLPAIISEKQLRTFKIAETEKYAHVTYFFNGGREVTFPLEDRFLIPSLKIPTYDLQPQMRVFEITRELIERIESQEYSLLVANFANADMVGHTGNLKATIAACEHIDTCLGMVLEAIHKTNSLLVVTADHGNAEVKYDEIHKEIATEHTTNPVPFLMTHKDMQESVHLNPGTLADIAPTILPRIGLECGVEMNGNNLV